MNIPFHDRNMTKEEVKPNYKNHRNSTASMGIRALKFSSSKFPSDAEIEELVGLYHVYLAKYKDLESKS